MPVEKIRRTAFNTGMDTIAGMAVAPVILFDGDCGMCHHVVRFVLKHERDAVFKFAPLGSAYARAALSVHGLDEPPSHTVVVIAGESLFVRSDAALLIAARFRMPWRSVGIIAFAPRPIRDALYDFVARRRHFRFPRPRRSHPVPDDTAGERFLR